MPTKAQEFRVQQQRNAKPARPKRPAKPRRDDPVDTSRPGTSATDRKAAVGESGSRNESLHASRKGGASLEESATGRPSRKSTRKSAGRIKRTSNQQRKAIRTASAPKTRATQARARR